MGPGRKYASGATEEVLLACAWAWYAEPSSPPRRRYYGAAGVIASAASAFSVALQSSNYGVSANSRRISALERIRADYLEGRITLTSFEIELAHLPNLESMLA